MAYNERGGGINGGIGYEWGVYMLCGVIDEIWGKKVGIFIAGKV